MFPFGALSLDNPWSEEMGATELFSEVVVRAYPWSERFSADAFMELLLTQSDHRLAGEDERQPLFDALRELITRHGGEVVVPLATVLVLTRRRG